MRNNLEIEIDHWTPAWYLDGSEFQLLSSIECIDCLDFSGARTILDIGCGDGKISNYLSEKNPGACIEGLDISKEMIEFSKERYSKSGVLEFFQGDIQSIKMSRQYDYIVSFWALSWLSNHEKAVENIWNSLKINGSLFLLIPTNNDLLFLTIESILSDDKWDSVIREKINPTNTATCELYKKIFLKCNTTNIKVELRRIQYDFNEKDKLKKYVKGWLPLLKNLDQAQQENLLEDFVSIYNNFLFQTNQKLNTIYFDCIVVSGRKVNFQ